MKLCRCEIIYSLLLYVLISCSSGVNAAKQGLTCKCKLVTDCPVALDALSRTFTHPLKRCGFDGMTEIVCCPETEKELIQNSGDENNVGGQTDSVHQTRFTKRRCEQACEELSSDYKFKVNFNIYGGVNADIEEFPHMVVLGYETDEGLEWDCSASIISKRYLLTAAHCIANNRRLVPKKARMGVTMLNDTNPQDYNISDIAINPRYNPSSKHNDIALLKVHRDIKFSKNVYPACIYFRQDDPLGLIVTGWGKTTKDIKIERSNILQKANLVPMSLPQCNDTYVTRSSGTFILLSTQLCAGSNISDACGGDSGGPLQIQNKAGTYSIVGIVSYGAGCGGNVPGVYTRVSKYLEWIENIVWP